MTNVGVLAAVAAAAVAVVAAAVGVAVGAAGAGFETSEHYQGWMPTEEIFSTDEILSRRQRPPTGAAIWSSACCTARPALRAGSHAGPGDPGRTEEEKTR